MHLLYLSSCLPKPLYCSCQNSLLCCQISDPNFYTHTHIHIHVRAYTHTHTQSTHHGKPKSSSHSAILSSPGLTCPQSQNPCRHFYSVGGPGSELNQTVKKRSISGVSFSPTSLGCGCPAPSCSCQADRRHWLCSTQRRLGQCPCFAQLYLCGFYTWFLHMVLLPSISMPSHSPPVSLSLLHTIHICFLATVMLKIESDYRNHTVAAWGVNSLFICADLSGNICIIVGNNSNGHLFCGDILAIWDRPLGPWF